jgi:hypothetical protein
MDLLDRVCWIWKVQLVVEKSMHAARPPLDRLRSVLLLLLVALDELLLVSEPLLPLPSALRPMLRMDLEDEEAERVCRQREWLPTPWVG